MGVYIEGMEMPTSPVLFCIHPDGKVFADLEGWWREYQAAPVSPYCRLIDADALKDLYHHSVHNSDIDTAWVCTIRRSIDKAPTIIPAEEE